MLGVQSGVVEHRGERPERRRGDEFRDALDLDPEPPSDDQQGHHPQLRHEGARPADVPADAVNSPDCHDPAEDLLGKSLDDAQQQVGAARQHHQNDGDSPQLLHLEVAHRVEQEHAQPSLGTEPLTQHRPRHRGRSGDSQPVDDIGDRVGHLQQAEAFDLRRAQNREDIVGRPRSAGEA